MAKTNRAPRSHAGVSRGCGWQHLAALTNLVAFYLVGMPLAIFFAFKLKLYTKVNDPSVSDQFREPATLIDTCSNEEDFFGYYNHLNLLQGLWAGLICGLVCQACSLLVITVCTKWSKIAEAMQQEKANYGGLA